jgi:hypothetical protein
MIEKIVQTAKQAVNAAVLVHKTRSAPLADASATLVIIGWRPYPS